MKRICYPGLKKKGDSLFLNEGFRDLIDFLNDIGISTKSSAFLVQNKNSFVLNSKIHRDLRLPVQQFREVDCHIARKVVELR